MRSLKVPKGDPKGPRDAPRAPQGPKRPPNRMSDLTPKSDIRKKPSKTCIKRMFFTKYATAPGDKMVHFSGFRQDALRGGKRVNASRAKTN